LSGNTIPSDDLVYQSLPQTVGFKHKNWGNFTVVGFMGDKYFAGYPDEAVNGSVDRVSVLSNSVLTKVLTDSDDKTSISQGSNFALQEGYSLSIKEVDVNGNSVWVQLEKDGSVVDDNFVSAGQDYVYKTDIGKATDVPLIIVHFGTVFSGAETSAVFMQGIFQLSDEYTEIKNGDTFDKMEVTDVSDSGIKMKNSDDIGLSRGENTTVMNNVSFKTADDSTLRFYPYVTVNGGGGSSANGLNISVPDEIFAGSAFDITVTADGDPLENVIVKVNGNSTGNTSADGIVQYTAENTGALKLTAEKSGYSSGSKNVNVLPPKEEMSLSVSPDKVYIGDNITITALKKIGGDPIAGANISIDDKSLGATGSDGTIAYKTEKNGTIKVSATKEGFTDNSIDVQVRALEPIFEVSNLTVNPAEVGTGKNATISANILNVGNAAGNYSAVLYINNNTTDSKDVYVDIGGNKTVTFAHSEEKPGNYTAELGDQTIKYTVKENSPILLYALIIVIVLLIGGAAYYFTKGGGDIGATQVKMQEKVQELISSIKLKK
jgi:S-layer protein (TIGR01567 family)